MAKAVAMLMALAVVVAVSSGGASADCNIAALASCNAAVIQGAKPTAMCCSSLRAQEPCLCTYQNNPKYGKYHPNARKMVTSCGMAIPNC
ncbi:hypothetical protein BDA96_07G001600 [Sorghum bicolor]|uniref:Bifunctional inhibitor/plant lipid transfer protein/seed storage helical domain-containing protein n=2 Tax=Sorghum bicolor TaxID=4558 RepID=A0A921U889_SORBI|nr:non-specific lipid-transfer protein 2P [Sorghum bicolor]EES13181.1 hypothetical protein SORBI_3007G001600 [Sorghum bicolor]KAG0522024.1 hypothetical protein BDA96_07G001600 [Sorghum bicolor]|eukprot:XP_002443686.1 non-specific lipid-transfer protein 2P [Sorghum bicolor]